MKSNHRFPPFLQTNQLSEVVITNFLQGANIFLNEQQSTNTPIYADLPTVVTNAYEVQIPF